MINMNSPKKCCEPSSVSLKGAVTDNDSGYISQNVESNSSYDASLDNRPTSLTAPELGIKEAFLGENALLEKPSLTLKSDQVETDDFGEFGHLYFMSSISDNAVVPSSVSSQNTTFSGFDEVLNLSGTIPVAPSIILTEPIPEAPVKMKTFVLHPDKENDSNYENIKNNIKVDSNESRLNSSFEDTEATLNSIQTRLMSANNEMSLFESFYSFVCKLYTKNEPVLEDTEINSINPSQLHINQKQKVTDSPHKNLYLELENVKKVPEVCSVNSSTPTKQKTSAVATVSPELFSDDETEPVVQNNSSLQKSLNEVICDDYALAKRTRDSLGGVPPPPSITLPLVSAAEILDKAIENKALFTTQEDVNNFKQKEERQRCLLIDANATDYKTNDWPAVSQIRYHGIHYNRSKINEEFEHLCVQYAERYIGAETQSSCTVFGMGTSSPTKRRFKYGRTVKSPGKNLSHLARRRITFSRESLGISANCASIGSRTRQIMVDAKKFDMLPRRKSPKKKSPRKTPRKSPQKKSNTPKSSDKKKHMLSFSSRAIEENLNQLSFLSSARPSTTKRALFQSPQRKECNSSLSWFNSDNSNSSCSQHSNRSSRRALFPSPKRNSPSKMTISSIYPARRKMTPKRALFKSPDKQSTSVKDVCDKKRKRVEDVQQVSNKLARGIPTDTEDSSSDTKPSTSLGSSQDISQHRKKKLMWTVAEALRTQNIDLKHPQFKVYASVLARVIRHFLPNLFTNGPRTEGSTTESMLRIARQYVFAVTRGKTVDQIIREAQKKSRIRRSSGCTDLDKLGEASNVLQVRNKENILQDRINIMEESSNNRPLNKVRRSEKVERIRRVINFGDDNDVSNTSIR
ncbi:hypothetical protein RI129_002473 [Pyrocoelia pectoralis]|uniref:Uncharacterized protein n=1 Tax=Pyrocoelia pectoralis TaxID=417401 RepID=A0AAN7VLZ9_9COLE